MLDIREFIGKRHIIMDKAVETYVMERFDKGWKIVTISKWNKSEPEVSTEIVQDYKAWEFYKERMQSFGFRPFQIIAE